MAKGNNRFNTCNGAYKGSLNVGTETRGDDDVKENLQKMIPDGWIGRFFLDAPFNSPPNRLDDRETFVEFKTLASLAMSPNVRAQQAQSNIEKRADYLDLMYPGSTFTQVLKFHGKVADTSCWSSALLQTFPMISWSCVTFLDELVPSKRFIAGTSAPSTRWR